MIREIIPDDRIQILEIYRKGIDSGNATFETEAPSWEDWDSKHLKHSRLAYLENDKILGWIALSPVSVRKVYEGVAEISIYVDPDFQRRGIGSKLLEQIIKSSEEHGIWTLCSVVFPENTATLKLHGKYGFRIVGTRKKIGCHKGKWRDTVLLERRSKAIGF
jgi:L-amino acid N-acyltransferase YncA